MLKIYIYIYIYILPMFQNITSEKQVILLMIPNGRMELSYSKKSYQHY